MRKSFHEELAELKEDVVQLAKDVREVISSALEVVLNEDLSRAKDVMKKDDEIDSKVLEIEEKGIAIIARQAPVAKDLRLLHAILFINTHLERMGDLAYNIARNTKYLARRHEEEKKLLTILEDMGNQTLKVVDASIRAFEKKDISLAEELPKLDEPIDRWFKDFFKALAKVSGEHHSLDWASNMVLVCRWLERIADHAVDIGERVTYLVTGEITEPSQ